MKLSEKILSCRKKAGFSQEALAELIDVSRQAISKWETGEAVPEIGKLPLLAKTFHVTTDWLLSEDEPESDNPASECRQEQAHDSSHENTTWVDSIPGVIGKLIRRYGWLYGVYTALAGLGFTIIGILARVLTRIMFSNDLWGTNGGLDPFGGIGFDSNTTWYDEAGNVIPSPFGSQVSSFATNNPVAVMGTVIMVIGIVMMIAGVVLAIYLKKRGNGVGK